MSMVFNSAKAMNMYCPKCRVGNGDNAPEDEDIECWKCKMVYRRSISRTLYQPSLISWIMTAQITPATATSVKEFQLPENVSSSKMEHKTLHDEDYEMALFRRVRIKTLVEFPAPDSYSGTPGYIGAGNLEPPFNGLNEELMHRDYDLPCILSDILRCSATFTGEEYQDWVKHSISHYRNSDPPTYARCIFCDKTFQSKDAWQRRMSHIADHFKRGKSIVASRPDFWVLKDMREKGDLSREQYNVCLSRSERPPFASLRPLNWEPEEIIARREAEAKRADWVRAPLRKVQRHSRPR
jgi:hypothetical protein